MSRRVAILCPGRGSYGESSRRSLPEGHPWVVAAERARHERGLESLVALDRSERFQPDRHLRPSNISPLIYLVSSLHAAAALGPGGEGRAVCVAGNSLGWYTALAVAGALSFEDGLLLVQEISSLQEGVRGGQVLWPLVDETWRRSAARERELEEALARSAGEVEASIHLGGYAVLAGSEEGVARLLRELGPVTLGRTRFPLRLAWHGPYHTSRIADVAARAREILKDLEFVPPKVPLIDGRGVCFSPWSTDPSELRAYTLDTQLVTPYDFTSSVRVALREYAPERLVLPGPGNSLGAVCGHVLVEEGWRGIRSRSDFDREQEGDEPVVVSMDRGR